MANWRLVLTNSEQLAVHSQFRKGAQAAGSSATGLGERKALANTSRLGLGLSNQMGEYIVGAHRIGNVLDTKASRGAMPTGHFNNVRTAPGSAAVNLNVGIAWETADALFRKYDNTEGSIAARHQLSKPDTERGPLSNPAVQTHYEYAEMALEDAQMRAQETSLAIAAAKTRRETTATQALPAAEAVQRKRLDEANEAKLQRDRAEAAVAASPSDPALVKARTEAQEAHGAATRAAQAADAAVKSLQATLAALDAEIPRLEAKKQRRSDFVAERNAAFETAKRVADEASAERTAAIRAAAST